MTWTVNANSLLANCKSSHMPKYRDASTEEEMLLLLLLERIDQGPQTRGPWAACGTRNYFVRPAAMSTNLKNILDKNYFYYPFH